MTEAHRTRSDEVLRGRWLERRGDGGTLRRQLRCERLVIVWILWLTAAKRRLGVADRMLLVGLTNAIDLVIGRSSIDIDGISRATLYIEDALGTMR